MFFTSPTIFAVITPAHIALGIGFLLPAVSWITLGLSMYDKVWRGKHSSPVFIPVIGPAILTLWIVVSHRSLLWIPVAWIGDIGTVAFALAIPAIIREVWHTKASSVGDFQRNETQIRLVDYLGEKGDLVLVRQSDGFFWPIDQSQTESSPPPSSDWRFKEV